MAKKAYLYGRHPVAELLRERPRDVHRLFVASARKTTAFADVVSLAQRNGVQVIDVAKRKLAELVGDVPHQGIVALVTPFAYVDVEEMLAVAGRRNQAPLIVALDQIQDPHNLGALVRSSFALGAHGVIMPKDRSCEVTPAVVKASAGATAHLLIGQITNLRRSLEELKEAGLWIVGTVVEGGQPLTQADFLQPTVLVVGSEGKGIRPLTAKTCDILVQIPMAGRLGSLNASAAGAICLYEALRQRAGS